MRRSRRFLALLFELLVLYVAAASGGVACAACAAERVSKAVPAHHEVHANTSHQSQQHHHDGPSSRQHQHDAGQCLMADGCTVATASAEFTQAVATLADERDRMIVADEHLLRSARPAPEPPPPRV